MTLGFNGTNANVIADASKITTLELAGLVATTQSSASSWTALMEPSVGYITFGVQNAGNSGLVKATGSGLTVNNITLSINALIPISGW